MYKKTELDWIKHIDVWLYSIGCKRGGNSSEESKEKNRDPITYPIENKQRYTINH